MSKKSAAVLFGGASPGHDASVESAAVIISQMSDEKYLTVPVYVTKDGRWLLYDGPLSNFKTVPFEKFGSRAVISPDTEHNGLLRIVNGKVKNIPVDVAFPLFGGAEGLFELSGIPYAGCGVFSSELCKNRAAVKQLAKNAGLATPDYFEFSSGDLSDMAQVTKKIRYKLGYPVLVKPTGVIAENKKELEEALESTVYISSGATVQKNIPGKKIDCLVIGDNINAESSVLGGEDIPEDISGLAANKAAELFKAASCFGLVQITFILKDDNSLLLDEIKTIPDYASICGYPVMTPALIDRLFEMALSRCGM